MTRTVIINKYRNELGKAYRKAYDGGLRNEWCRRSAMRSYQCRPDFKCGTLQTFTQENLLLETYEKMNRRDIASTLFRKVREQQLKDFKNRMPKGKQGVEFEIGGVKYIAAIRRLTPTECARLQTVPSDYEFVTSETQQYRCLGNGWTVDVIRHILGFLPERLKTDGMKVLSLFDGMSCGQVALNGIGAKVDQYLASEIDKHAIANTMHNFPNTVQLGSVTDINVDELVKKYGVPDIIMGGSPCQSFSFSGKMNGMSTKGGEEIYTLDRYLELKSQGFEFEGQSYLFWEYMRILTELRKYNPNIYFLLENVKMLEKWERCLSHAIGVRGVHINSALVSAQQRKRIYWSNIRTRQVDCGKLFPDEDDNDPFSWPNAVTDIPQPEDRGLVIKDVLQEDADEKYYLKDETVRQLIGRTDKSKLKDYLLEPQVSVDEALEYMNAHAEYDGFADEEKRDIAAFGYELEKQRLKENYHAEGVSNG